MSNGESRDQNDNDETGRNSAVTAACAFLSKYFVYEKSKKTRNMLIARIAIFAVLIAVFFLNTGLYLIPSENGTVFMAKRVFAVVLMSPACVLLPVFKLKLPQRAVYTVQFFMIFGTMIIALWAGENVFGFKWTELQFDVIIFNIVIMFAVFTAVYIVCNRMKAAVLAVYCLTVLFAAVNYYVEMCRGEAITAADVITVGTALEVLGDYTIELTWEIYKAFFCGAALFGILTFLPAEHRRVSGWKRVLYIIPGTVLVIFILFVFVKSDYPLEQGVKVKTFRPIKTYKLNGQLLNFVRGFYYMQVIPPEEYSAENARAVIESSGYESDDAGYDDGEKNPNIIIIMNESLTDYTKFSRVDLSEDPFEYIHSLKGKDNAILGELDVNVFGGRTAITEYETITGNSAAFFPANAVPYALFVNDRMPSITWNLIDAGYSGNLAFHPFKARGYSRRKAYPYLGFREFVSIETIQDNLSESDYVRNYVSDSADFRELIRLYEESRSNSDAPFYMFNVTMQNHGAYDENFDNFDQDIQPKGIFTSNTAFKRFINLMDYSDEAFEELTAYFEKVDEPTIIVMYGDHLPSLGSEFYTSLFGRSRTSLDSYKTFLSYRTPLIIWANYDINKGGKYNDRFEKISVNYLSACLMDIAGVPMTAYQKFLSDMQKEIPSFTLHGYLDKEGVFYEVDDIESPYYDKWVLKYHYYAYNNQFDKKNRINSFFRLKSDSNAMDEE